MARLNYDRAEKFIRELPATWIPALLLLMVRVAYAKKVFIKGRATRFIKDNVEGEEP